MGSRLVIRSFWWEKFAVPGKPSTVKRSRHSIRLKEYDYSQPGSYFVTTVAYQRRCLFGEVVDGKVQLTSAGTIVSEMWRGLPDRFLAVSVDAFVIMPNHIHGIVAVGAQFIAPSDPPHSQNSAMNRVPTLGQIIRTVKAASTHKIRQTSDIEVVWQRNYYEHVIRDEESLNRIRQYILDNPLRWEFDPENPAATKPERNDAWRVS
jgi:REP element-mobilizing transposase RayT